MKTMKESIYVFLLIFALIIQNLRAEGIRDQGEQEARRLFGNNVILKLQKVILNSTVKNKIEKSVRQRFSKDFVYVWKISESDSIRGYAVLDNVYGKSMPITFIVIINSKGRVLKTNVIKYREAYGGQISNLSWLKQFEGKDVNSGYESGKDVDGISGATISVNAITKGIKKLVLLFPYIQKNVN